MKKIFSLTWKKTGAAVSAFILAAVLHNVLSSPDWEEPFFFIIAVIIVPAYLAVSLCYSAWLKLIKGKEAGNAGN